MENISNRICRAVIGLLPKHGVRKVFVSPGSRNVPLLVALSKCDDLSYEVVVDERSAAFMALGYSMVVGEPVALICTSGTALLNYAPAVAEAYYRKVPLIVISADRPKQWIGQDDSQTIVQPEALANYVKRSYDIYATDSDEELWFANRVTNDALLTAVNGRVGPVHLNVQLAEPLNKIEEVGEEHRFVDRVVRLVAPKPLLEVSEARRLGMELASPLKVMIVCGFLNPDKTLNAALKKLSDLPNIIVLTETISNLHSSDFVSSIDTTLASIPSDSVDEMSPDVVITCGGALVSRHIKQFLRTSMLKGHWHIGESDDTIDCFCRLSMRIELNPALFFQQLASAMQPHRAESDYGRKWRRAADRAEALTQSYVAKSAWSDLKAFATLIPMIPRRWNVQFSNGTSIRYGQIFGRHEYHRCDCNRGVSGIDGSTSTAIGASLAYNRDVTLLISGDMSAVYDSGVLVSGRIPWRFKMIVVENGGGGIFRFIPSTSQLEIREDMLALPDVGSIAPTASAVGIKTFTAADEKQLRETFPIFASYSDGPALLVVDTRSAESAEVLNKFIEYCRTN